MAEKEQKVPKEQKATKETVLFDTANEISSLWMEFRKYVRFAFSNKPVDREKEQEFLSLKSDLSRLQRILGQRLPDGFRYGSRGMSDLMGQAISLVSLRELPLADKKGIYARWHDAHIKLQHMLGILDVMAEGHQVAFETVKAKTGNLKQDIGLIKEQKKSNVKKVVVALLIIAAVGGALYWVITNS